MRFRNVIILAVLAALTGSFTGSAHAARRLPFQGFVDFSRRNVDLEFQPQWKTPYRMTIRQEAGGTYLVLLDFKNYQTPFFKLSTILEGRFRVREGYASASPGIIGQVRSRYTLMDQKPTGDFEADFEIREGKFFLRSLFSENLTAKGVIQVAAPYAMDMDMEVSDVDVNAFLAAMDPVNKGTVLGPFYGKVRVFGDPDRVAMKGRLATRSGMINGLSYEDMLLNFEGNFPVVIVNDSSITQPDGMVFNLSGTLDLTNLKNFDTQLSRFTSEPMVRHDGRDLEWTLKRLQNDRGNGTSEVKYLLRKGSGSHPSVREGGGMLGLERKMEF